MKTAQVSKDVPQPTQAEKSSDERKEPLYDPNAETLYQPRFVLVKQTGSMSKLPSELLVEIAKRIKNLEDFTCFTSVSRSLNLSVEEDYFEGLRLRKSLPYLMLPPDSRDGNDNIRQFYSLVEGESIVASLEVPALKTTTKMYFESLGWLLTVEVDGSTSLLDPFSDTEIPLPHLHTFPRLEGLALDKRFLIRRMVLSSRPNETSDFIMMVIIGDRASCAFWRLGDIAWNEIDSLKFGVCDVVYGGGGQFYGICSRGTIWVINFDAGNVECRIIIDGVLTLSAYRNYGQYLLKTMDGSLLLIKRTRDRKYFVTNEIVAYEIDIERGRWKEIYSLGSMAVFIGRNSSITLDATAPNGGGVIKANHIYFTDDFGEVQDQYFRRLGGGERVYLSDSPDTIACGADSGVYNLETGDIEAIYPAEPLLSNVCPAMWITPNLCF